MRSFDSADRPPARGLVPSLRAAWRGAQHRLFKALMAAEVKKAGLVRHERQMPYGRQVYLDNGVHAGGMPLVFLHGAGADKTTWLRCVQALGRRQRVLVLDLPGHGESTLDLTLDYGVPAQAERILQLLAALGLAPACCVGSSMGGAIALRLAHRYPQSVAALVLIGSAGAQSRPSWLVQQMAHTGVNVMAGVDSIAGYRRMLAVGMVKPVYLPAFALRILVEEKIRHAEVDRKVLADITSSLDQRDILSGIRAPTLIVWGREDRVVHVDDADLLQQSIAGSRKVVLDHTGHVPMVEQPRQVALLINEFLGQQ